MIEFIKDHLETANEYVLEQIYEFLQEVEYWKEVIPYLIGNRGAVKSDLLDKQKDNIRT